MSPNNRRVTLQNVSALFNFVVDDSIVIKIVRGPLNTPTMTIEAIITSTLQSRFDPQVLQVINQSHQHQGGLGPESHFKVVLVCAGFSGQSRLARHRAVYQVLKPLLKPVGSLHALALHTYNQQEWEQCHGSPPHSPPCAR